MADDSVVVGADDDGEIKVVTEFLLNTCRLLQPSRHHVEAAAWCAVLAETRDVFDDDVYWFVCAFATKLRSAIFR